MKAKGKEKTRWPRCLQGSNSVELLTVALARYVSLESLEEDVYLLDSFRILEPIPSFIKVPWVKEM